MQEFEDYILVDGQRFDKPFVEKPVSGENHNVWIYYPRRCAWRASLCAQRVVRASPWATLRPGPLGPGLNGRIPAGQADGQDACKPGGEEAGLLAAVLACSCMC